MTAKKPQAPKCPHCRVALRDLQDYDTLAIFKGCPNWVSCGYRLSGSTQLAMIAAEDL